MPKKLSKPVCSAYDQIYKKVLGITFLKAHASLYCWQFCKCITYSMVFVKSSKHMQYKNLLPSTITHNIKKKSPGNVTQSTEESKRVACSIHALYIFAFIYDQAWNSRPTDSLRKKIRPKVSAHNQVFPYLLHGKFGKQYLTPYVVWITAIIVLD